MTNEISIIWDEYGTEWHVLKIDGKFRARNTLINAISEAEGRNLMELFTELEAIEEMTFTDRRED